MLCYKESIKVSGSADYANVTWYLLDYSEEILIDKRPMVVICPGGGYAFTSDREAEMFAMQWLSFGYHAAVIRYSVSPEARYPVALTEVADVILQIKAKADEWRVDTDKIILHGSSAGGHLVCNYAVAWNTPFLKNLMGVNGEELKIAGVVLNYPVISSGPFAHDASFENLLGDKYDEMKDALSLEKCVNADMPPAFIWTTNEDGLVPAENSLMLALEMRKLGLQVELHMYTKGAHGLGLADLRTIDSQGGALEPECTTWFNLARIWMETVIL